jgi:hypothetical protein
MGDGAVGPIVKTAKEAVVFLYNICSVPWSNTSQTVSKYYFS